MTSLEKVVPIFLPPSPRSISRFIEDPIVSPEERAEAEEKSRRYFWEKCESALKYYNKKHRTNFELVEPLTTHSMMRDSFWSHFNFKAKDKSASDEGSPVKLFFGEERFSFEKKKYQFTTCRILDGDKQGADCTGCEHAAEPIIHPCSGFKMGVLDRNFQRLKSLRPRPPKRQRNE